MDVVTLLIILLILGAFGGGHYYGGPIVYGETSLFHILIVILRFSHYSSAPYRNLVT